MIMLKFELFATLALVLSIPLLARADNDWSFSSGSILGSISLSHQAAPPSSLTIDWPSSRLEIYLTEAAYLDSQSEKAPVEARTSWGRMDYDGFDNISLLNEPFYDANSIKSLPTNSGSWLIKAYIESTHRRNKWRQIFETSRLDISPLPETNDLSTEITSSFPEAHKAFSWILLLLAFIGWGVGRRFQNQQALDDQALAAPKNQRLPQEAS